MARTSRLTFFSSSLMDHLGCGRAGQHKAVLAHFGESSWLLHELQESFREVEMFGCLDHARGLDNGRIIGRRNCRETSLTFHRWCQRQRKRDDSRIRTARLNELRGLRYVLA